MINPSPQNTSFEVPCSSLNAFFFFLMDAGRGATIIPEKRYSVQYVIPWQISLLSI